VHLSFLVGNISVGDILTVLPFQDIVDMIKIRGKYLRQAFENSVARYDPVERPGAFLQVSGKYSVYNCNLNFHSHYNIVVY